MPREEAFPLPESLEEAEALRQELTLDVQSIQAQLGDRQRTDENGNRLSASDYWAWKRKANNALNQRLDELRMVKQWIRDRRNPAGPRDNASTHLRELHKILERLSDEGCALKDEERRRLKDAGQYLVSLNAAQTGRVP
jgi:hypothetical protein